MICGAVHWNNKHQLEQLNTLKFFKPKKAKAMICHSNALLRQDCELDYLSFKKSSVILSQSLMGDFNKGNSRLPICSVFQPLTSNFKGLTDNLNDINEL